MHCRTQSPQPPSQNTPIPLRFQEVLTTHRYAKSPRVHTTCQNRTCTRAPHFLLPLRDSFPDLSWSPQLCARRKAYRASICAHLRACQVQSLKVTTRFHLFRNPRRLYPPLWALRRLSTLQTSRCLLPRPPHLPDLLHTQNLFTLKQYARY